jgi:ABC-type transport system involved in cytochrome c biogenesis permease component
MNFFPVVGRELQIAARKPLTYRLRVVTVFICLAFCARAVIQYSNMGNLGTGQGINLFFTLSAIAFLFSSFAGVFVCSDSLSREKRDGTLGLLFLTDLRPIDVVFGKLFAHGLNLFYGLLAFVPILAMTLQMGGVSLNLVGKTVLMLLNSLFFSIAIGTYISSISQDERKALWASIGLLLALYIGPYILIGYLSEHSNPGLSAFLIFISPMTALNSIVGGIFGGFSMFNIPGVHIDGMGFYVALLVPHLLAWFLLYRSGRAISRVAAGGTRPTWFDEIRERWHYFLFGRGEQRRVHRQWLLDHHPMTWMVMREKLKLKYVWTLVISVMFIWVIGYATNGEIMAESSVLMSLGMFVHFFLKIWVASEAASAIAEDRRTGLLNWSSRLLWALMESFTVFLKHRCFSSGNPWRCWLSPRCFWCVRSRPPGEMRISRCCVFNTWQPSSCCLLIWYLLVG